GGRAKDARALGRRREDGGGRISRVGDGRPATRVSLPRSTGRTVSRAGAESVLDEAQVRGSVPSPGNPSGVFFPRHRGPPAPVRKRRTSLFLLAMARALGLRLADHAAPRPKSRLTLPERRS